jgi:hypothetical protein
MYSSISARTPHPGVDSRENATRCKFQSQDRLYALFRMVRLPASPQEFDPVRSAFDLPHSDPRQQAGLGVDRMNAHGIGMLAAAE